MSAAPHLRLVQTPVDENGEIHACPTCRDALNEAETWEQEVLKLKRQLKQALEDRDARMRNDKDFPAAVALFDEWRAETNHPRARFDSARMRLALAAVKLYRDDLDKLSWVIKRAKHFPYVDPRGVRHDSFGLLFRDAEHIERYANEWHRRRREVEAS